jgi:hypothetical protein
LRGSFFIFIILIVGVGMITDFPDLNFAAANDLSRLFASDTEPFSIEVVIVTSVLEAHVVAVAIIEHSYIFSISEPFAKLILNDSTAVLVDTILGVRVVDVETDLSSWKIVGAGAHSHGLRILTIGSKLLQLYESCHVTVGSCLDSAASLEEGVFGFSHGKDGGAEGCNSVEHFSSLCCRLFLLI